MKVHQDNLEALLGPLLGLLPECLIQEVWAEAREPDVLV